MIHQKKINALNKQHLLHEHRGGIAVAAVAVAVAVDKRKQCHLLACLAPAV